MGRRERLRSGDLVCWQFVVSLFVRGIQLLAVANLRVVP